MSQSSPGEVAGIKTEPDDCSLDDITDIAKMYSDAKVAAIGDFTESNDIKHEGERKNYY
jgi:hypothetical protein